VWTHWVWGQNKCKGFLVSHCGQSVESAMASSVTKCRQINSHAHGINKTAEITESVCVTEGEQVGWESVESASFSHIHKEMPVCSTRSQYL